jgi:glyoxylase I family protein
MPKTPDNAILGGGGFHHVALKVHDFDRSVKLYTQVFGFREKIRWGQKDDKCDARAIMLDVGDGNYVELFAGGPKTRSVPKAGEEGPILHLAFRSRNVDAVIERARQAGLAVTMEPKDVTIPSTPAPTPVHIAFCQGYDGELLEFFQNEAT